MTADIHVESNELLRFSDMIEEPRRRFAPLRGYEHMKLVSLDEATDPLVPYVPEVKYMVQNALEDSVLMNDSLSTDERASIILYSMEWSPKENSFQRYLNRTLRSPRRADCLPAWFLFLKLLLTALAKLPSTTTKIVYRGVKMNVKQDYPEGSKIIWWGFSSCTSSMDILEDERFIGKSGTRTLFTIECDTCRDIRKYTLLPEDEEILLLPGCEFQVLSSTSADNDTHVIHLKEIQPKFPHIAPVGVENISAVDKVFISNNQNTEGTSKLVVGAPKSPLKASSNWQEFRDVVDGKSALKNITVNNQCVNINKVIPDGSLMTTKATEISTESNLSPQASPVEKLTFDKKTEVDRSNAIRNGTLPINSNAPTKGALRISSSNNSASDSHRCAQTAISSDRNLSSTSFDEENIRINVRMLVQNYAENYSEKNDRPTKAAIKELLQFTTSNIEQQSVVVRELFISVLKSKQLTRKAFGYLLNIVVYKKLITEHAFLHGIKVVVGSIGSFSLENPPTWQRVGEFIGAFIGGPGPNVILLKPIFQMIPNDKSMELFETIMHYALEISSTAHMQTLWKLSGLSPNDLIQLDSTDTALINRYSWLSPTTKIVKENPMPHFDERLVDLFKAIAENGPKVTDNEILQYIRTNMNSTDKYFIRNIVLSYLEACLVERDGQRRIQKSMAKSRMSILNHVVNHKIEAEVQVVYAIQNFVHKLGHPSKTAQLLFDMFYDEECVSEEAFFRWFDNVDQSETEGYETVKKSTKDFFTWLEQADTEAD